MNEWQTLTLADVCTVITDGAHQSPKTVSRGKPMASVKDLTRFGVDLTSARHIATEDFEALVKQGCKPHVGDVLIAKDGNSALDTVCTVDHPLDAVLLSSVAILRPDPKCLDSVFLKFYLSSPETIDYLKSNFISGAAIPRVVLRDFKRAEIRLPSLDVQRRIAGVLQSIDSKIDLNRRVNQTLEAIAQAIFQSWFVDFYPVKAKIAAKAEGRDPLRAAMSAMSGKADAELDALPPAQYEQLAATAALFPDELVDSELGKMPKRWHSSTLGEHCAYLNRGISPKYIDEGGVLVLNQKCIRDFRLDPSKARRHDPNQRNVSGRELQQGDVLVNSTGVGTLGRVAQVLRLDEPTIVDSHVTVVRSGPTLNSAYLGRWFVMKQADIEAMGEGSTGQTELARGKLVSMLILVPDQAVLGAFADAVAPIQSLIATRDRESLVLQQTRDALLPRLLSGELQPTVALEGVDA